MRAPNLLMAVFLCCISSLNYADRYNSMSDANSPPTTFEDDPATSNNAFSETVEQPAIPVPAPVKKQPMAYAPDAKAPAAESEPTQPIPQPQTPPDETVGTPPCQCS